MFIWFSVLLLIIILSYLVAILINIFYKSKTFIITQEPINNIKDEN